MKKLLLLICTLAGVSSYAQLRIDSSFAFQSNPAKKYSIYVPSGYTAGTAHKMMLGLHPLNPNRWDAKSWCDTLVNFAETNNLLLVCPDGDADGRIDDPIDTAFTTALLDSMEVWYSVDVQKVYVMGFSWGGKTTYTYGLRRTQRFGGYIPIGAAVNSADIATIAANAANEAFYVVHGSFDSPSIRFTPLVNSLTANNAIVESNLLNGVPHTIDFTNRNAILSRAYFWVDSVNCHQINTASLKESETYTPIELFPNPVKKGNSIHLNMPENARPNYHLRILTLEGKLVMEKELSIESKNASIDLNINGLRYGNYLLLLENPDQKLKANLSIVN